jgi:hypothetical protein
MAKKSKAVKRASAGRKAKPKARKPAPAKARKVPPKAELKAEPKPPVSEKRSVWSFLGIGKKAKPKVGLMEVKNK